MRLSLLLAPCAALATAGPAAAETLKVPTDFSTIAGALAVSQDGDTISVAKGRYLESIEVTAPNVKLVGKKAVIDAQYAGVCITVSAPGVSVSGFTLINGLTDGLLGFESGLTVSKCTVLNCGSRGIVVQAGGATISGNTVIGCSNDGISFGATFGVETLIEKNECLRNGGNGIVANGTGVTVSHNRCERNEGDGLDVFIDFPVVDGDGPMMTIEKNVFAGNEDNGIILTALPSGLVTISDNDCVENADSGVFLNAPHVEIQGNHCDDNLDDGMNLSIENSVVSGNTASGNQGRGLLITGGAPVVDGVGPSGGGNQVEKNVCNDNTLDGICVLMGAGNVLESNKCSGNGDDGIDIDDVAATDTLVKANSLSKNGHEGLDNSGLGTDMIKNVCKGNGSGVCPDLAGTGDANVGTVDDFQDNTFGTGGESDFAELDSYENTTP